LESSENLKEDLLALVDEIWQSIDHSDDESLEEGVRVKKAFNEAVHEFTGSIEQVAEIVDNYSPEKPEPSPEITTAEDESRVITELDRHESHSLDEDFAYKRPYGFRLDGYAVSDVRTWRRLYEHTCKHLAEQFPEEFRRLPESDDFTTSRGNKYFTTSRGNKYFTTKGDQLRTASEIADGIHADTHFSANDICARIEELLDYFGIEHDKFRVYLREDRNA
jgi:hypothetical protein